MKRPNSKQPKERKPLTGSLPAGGGGTMIAHDLNGVWHNGIAGTEDNFMALDATGLPKDSGNKASDFAAAAHTHAHNDTTSKQGGSGSDFYHLPAPTANYIVRGNAAGTNAEYSDTIPDGIKATTQAAGDNTTKVATTAFVQTAVASVTGEVRFSPSSDMATIRTALADSTTPLIKFGAGTYDHGANNVIIAANKRLFLEGSNEWKVDAGNQVMTWTAADASRYWSISNDVRTVYWDAANSRFVKRWGEALPSIASSAEGFYAVLRDRKYLVSSTDVANNYLYVVETPYAVTKMDANGNTKAPYVAIFKPTSNVHIHGNLKITQNSGAPQKICSLVGLVDSSICADGELEFSQPSGSATAAGDAATCLISQIFNTRMNLALKKMYSTNSSTWWVWLQYTFKSYFYQMFEDVCLNYAGQTSGEHIGFHNTYLYGCNYVIAGGGLRTNSTAGLYPVVCGADFVYYEDPIIQGHSRDVETAIGTDAYGIAFGICLVGTGLSNRNTNGFLGTKP